MAQTKIGFITLTDINDGAQGVKGDDGTSGDTYITHTAYQNYNPASAVDLPTTPTSLGNDGVLTGLNEGWSVAPSNPTGAEVTFFTTRIFKRLPDTTTFIPEGTKWSDAVQLSGDIGRPGDPGVSNTGRYRDLQTAFASTLTLTTAGSVGNVLTATLGGTAITYTVVTGETSTTDMATGLASEIDGNGTFNGSATSSGSVITINRGTTFSTAFSSNGSTTGAYATVDNKDFNDNGIGSRWKIRTDNGLIPNTSSSIDQWTTSVNTLFLSSSDENGTAISDYYATLEAGDLGRLQTDADATPSSANVPDFCEITNINGEPFICDSPAGYVVFELIARGTCVGGPEDGNTVTEAACGIGTWTETISGTPVRMDPNGTVNAVNGGVWRMSIETVRVDTTPTLNTGSSVLANFGYNRGIEGTDGEDGATGDDGFRGAGRFDRSFTVTTASSPAVGSPIFNAAARCAVAGGYPFNTSGSTITCKANEDGTGADVALVTPVKGDVVVLTVTESDGDVETRGAIHNGDGVADSFWTSFAIQIDGSLLVQGTVVANALAVGSVTADKIDINPSDIGVGSSADSTTSRMVITGDKIQIYEGNTLRVVLGNLATP